MIKDLLLVLKGELSSRKVDKLGVMLATEMAHSEDIVAQRRFLAEEIRPLLLAIGRLLAKDKSLTTNELDKDRKAESDALGKKAIDRLVAEHKARRHTEGNRNV